jgi:hypothetical protein
MKIALKSFNPPNTNQILIYTQLNPMRGVCAHHRRVPLRITDI